MKQAFGFHIPALLGEQGISGSRQATKIGHRRPGDISHRRPLLQIEDIHQPGFADLFQRRHHW